MKKVLLVNGSPHRHGCTNEALTVIKETLEAEGIIADIYWVGNQPIGGCVACGACSKLKKCAFDDKVNEFTALAQEYDGFIFGSPVYYAGMSGTLKSFMERVFFSAGGQDPHPFRFKPVSCITSARRAGTTSSLDQMNKYFLHQQMPIISSRYWNMVHGRKAEDVRQDKEGLQTMRYLARNMAWFLKLVEAGEAAGIKTPEQEETRESTSFIR